MSKRLFRLASWRQKKQTPNAKFHKPGPITGGMYHKFLTSPAKNYSGLDGNASFSETFTTDFVGGLAIFWSPVTALGISWLKTMGQKWWRKVQVLGKKSGPHWGNTHRTQGTNILTAKPYIYMYEIIHYAGKQNMYKHTAQACLELVVGKWKIFSCWKSARLPLIFGNYIFGNYSFGKYFLSLQYRTGFRLKKSLGIFMTIGDPCGNLDDHLDMAPFFMACITPGVGDSWCGVPGENMEPNKNRGI